MNSRGSPKEVFVRYYENGRGTPKRRSSKEIVGPKMAHPPGMVWMCVHTGGGDTAYHCTVLRALDTVQSQINEEVATAGSI